MGIRTRTWKTMQGEPRTAYVFDYKDAQGKRRLKTFKKKKEALAFEAKVKAELFAGIHVPESNTVTVAEAGARWLAQAERDKLERASREQYEGLLRCHIAPHIGRLKLSDLSGPVVVAFDKKLHDSGVSPEMRRKVITGLSGLVERARLDGLVARNAVKGFRVKTDKRGKRRLKVGVDVPSFAEVEAFLDTFHRELPWFGFFLIAAYTGMRSSELRGLCWSSIDWDREVIHVTERADKFNKIGNPKSEGSERAIPMSGYVLAILQRLWREGVKDRDALVFATRSGKPYSLSNISKRVLVPAMLKAGLVNAEGGPKYSLHSFRHYFASWCAARVEDGGAGLELREVQQLLGHSKLSLTADTYSHFWPTTGIGRRMRAAEQKLVRATRTQQAQRQIEA